MKRFLTIVLDDAVQLFDSPEQMGLDGSGGDIQYFRDLLVSEAFFFYKFKNSSALVGQLVYGLVEAEVDLFPFQGFTGIVEVDELSMGAVGLHGDVIGGILGKIVEGMVADGDEKVGFQIMDGRELLLLVPDPDHDVVDYFFGHLLFVHIQHGEVE